MDIVVLIAAVVTAGAVGLVMWRWDVWRWLAALVVVISLLPVLGISGGRGGEAAAGVRPAALVVTVTSVGLALMTWRAMAPAVLAVLAVGTALLAVTAALVGAGLDDSAIDGAGPGSGTVVLLALAAAPAIAAAWGLGRSQSAPLRRTCAAVVGVPVVVVLTCWIAAWSPGAPSLTHLWAVAAWLPAAGALGVTGLLRGRRSRAVDRGQQDSTDEEAARKFDRCYSAPRLAPVVIVIAAYNEERGIGAVLAALPPTVGGLATDIVVIDDGSTDETVARVRDSGRAYLVPCSRNRGQGAAMRLGYRVAREHGATYVITTDADAQYDAAELPDVLAPLVDGRADFVTGSRLLGHQHSHDRVRRLGVHVFAWLVTALVGRRITDTSFGLRAMRVEVTAAVTLNQPQYQSSELLIGTLSHGFRVVEVPGTMRLRSAGSSKKGGNLIYGWSYARVVLGTWWREGCPRPVHERAPALRDSNGTADVATTG